MSSRFHRGIAFNPHLQGLRAVAIALVIVAHVEVPWLPGGFVGVDVFFVLSGYLITGILTSELARDGRIDLVRFYARRLRRLLPALVVMVGLSFAAASWLLCGDAAREQMGSAPFALTWTSNLYFALREAGPVSGLAEYDLFVHTWSLGVEEQFYLVWPLALLAAAGLNRDRQATSATRISLTTSLAAACVLSLVLSIYWSLVRPEFGFYQMPSRIWQFALGGLIRVHVPRAGRDVRHYAAVAHAAQSPLGLAAGMAALVGCAVWIRPTVTYPGVWALMPSLAAAWLILHAHSLPHHRPTLLAHPALVWLGDRSYALYLWHWPLIALALTSDLRDQPVVMLAAVLVALLAAMLSYRFVERPFWKGRLSTGAPRLAILVSVLVMASAVLVTASGK